MNSGLFSSEHDTSERGGRRERKRAETREKLFQSALRLFAQKGFAATTVEDITEAADVGKGTFFNYFPTKEHVLRHFGKRQVERITHWFESTRGTNEPAREGIARLLATATELPSANPEIIRAMVGSFLAQQAIREFLKGELALGRGMIADFLKEAQQRGEVRGDIPAEKLARTLQQSAFGAMLFWSLHQDKPLNDYLGTAFELLWTGIEPKREDDVKPVRKTARRR